MNVEFWEILNENFTKQSISDWVCQYSMNYNLPYLLAHAEDGVIWGYFNTGDRTLTIARDAFPNCGFPKLRLETLQQCRLFGKHGEVLLWKNSSQWCTRIILETKVSELLKSGNIGIIPEAQILWGTQGKISAINHNFTLLKDGSQGLKHAVPITVDENYFVKNKVDEKELYRPVSLEINHYFTTDDDGISRIFLSRLVSIQKKVK